MHDANDMLSPVAPGTPIHLPVREGPIAAHANLLRQMLMLAGSLPSFSFSSGVRCILELQPYPAAAVVCPEMTPSPSAPPAHGTSSPHPSSRALHC